MREIKFRAWDTEREVMTTVTHMGLDDSEVTMKDEECIRWRAPYPYICKLMQYTGIKDKNGKEIYEGDIVEFYSNVEDEIITEKVEYHFGIYRAGDYFVGKIYNKCKVIGNIYENPELLV